MRRANRDMDRRTVLGAMAVVGATVATGVAPIGTAAAAATNSGCGPTIAATIPHATGVTGSPMQGPHTHIFAVTLIKGTLQDGQTVTVFGDTSGPLQQFVLHRHPIDSTGVLGASCGFQTTGGGHTFTLHASDFSI